MSSSGFASLPRVGHGACGRERACPRSVGEQIDQPKLGAPGAEKIGQSTDGGVYAKLLARPLASMSTMRSAGVEFWALPSRYSIIRLGPWQNYNMVNENRGNGGFRPDF